MRRTRSDSVTAAIAAAQAPTVINPPAHVTLRDGDRPFWDSVVRARAGTTWNESDLEHAANLARCKADIETMQMEIAEQGNIIENDRGTPIINPGEVSIVALGTIKQKPWVVDGEVVPRFVTTVAASFDHRVVDGDVASRFLADVASIIEEPALLLD